jgi:hypothetical protein
MLISPPHECDPEPRQAEDHLSGHWPSPDGAHFRPWIGFLNHLARIDLVFHRGNQKAFYLEAIRILRKKEVLQHDKEREGMYIRGWTRCEYGWV